MSWCLCLKEMLFHQVKNEKKKKDFVLNDHISGTIETTSDWN